MESPYIFIYVMMIVSHLVGAKKLICLMEVIKLVTCNETIYLIKAH